MVKENKNIDLKKNLTDLAEIVKWFDDKKDVDLDAIMTGMEDLQDLRAEFGDKVAELTGNEDVQNVPGMLNQPQFKAIQMPSGLNQFVNQAQGQQMQQVDKLNSIGESNPQPSPAPMMAPGTY